jgi:UDP-N-acetyl-D-mannosaminuronate dehydrogenase
MPSREMRIGIIGSGYVGTVTGVGFADLGNEVIFVDFDHERVQKRHQKLLHRKRYSNENVGERIISLGATIKE